MKRNYTLYINDICDCIKKIEQFTTGMTFHDFVTDDKTSSAVIRMLEIMGEASKQVPGHIRNRYKKVPWSDMAAMRDKVIHFYFGVDYEIVWKVVEEEIPKLKPQLLQVLKEVKARE